MSPMPKEEEEKKVDNGKMKKVEEVEDWNYSKKESRELITSRMEVVKGTLEGKYFGPDDICRLHLEMPLRYMKHMYKKDPCPSICILHPFSTAPLRYNRVRELFFFVAFCCIFAYIRRIPIPRR